MTITEHEHLLKTYNSLLKGKMDHIDPQAVQILRRLKEAGYQAYLVGGGVRDLLVDLQPKDFDIATNALPNEVKKKVPYSFIIGRRFKLVHARRGDQIFEIATFRRAATTEELETADEDERHLTQENFFGNIEEDSFRRDFTVNSLFYDPIDHSIVDHCRGLQDIHLKTLRMIGDPKERLLEDPIRILRAIRLSQKLNFSIETVLRHEILNLTEELKRSVLPRRREEWLKFFRLPQPDLALIELFDLKVFETIIPHFHSLFSDDKHRSDFLSFLARFRFVGIDTSNPTELFSAVLISYLKTIYPDSYNLNDLSENEEFLLFCRDELGVFKAEVAVFFQAVQFINSLKKIEAYSKKGDRRKRSMVFHSTFDLSLKLGFLSYQLSPSQYLFWLEQKEIFFNSQT